MNLDQTENHINMLSQLAQEAQSGGDLGIMSYGEDPKSDIKIKPKCKRFEITDTSGMMKFIKSICDDKHRNIYMSASTMIAVLEYPMKQTSKGCKENVHQVLAFVGDIDDSDLQKYLDRLPAKPGYILKTSSDCYQAFLFPDRPLTREEAYPIALHLQDLLSDCDSCTQDLSHVWRIPGLLNWPNKKKVDEGRPAEPQLIEVVQSWTGERFDPDSLNLEPKIKTLRPKKLVFSETAAPPMRKFMMLSQTVPEFQASWDVKRDFKKKDGSPNPNAYDLSLCDYACLAGWSDQEMLDLMIGFRRENKFDPKLNNRQYFFRTIARARKEMVQKTADQDLELADDLRGSNHEPADLKKIALKAASDKIGINIIRINRYIQDNPCFVLVTDIGEVTLNNIKHLIRPGLLQERIAADLGFYIKYVKKTWPSIAQSLLDACTDVPVSPDSMLKGRIKEWITEYLEGKPELEVNHVFAGTNYLGKPFVYKKHWYIQPNSFLLNYVRFRDWRMDPQKLRVELKRCECESKPVNIKTEDQLDKTKSKWINRNFWRVPHEIKNLISTI